MKFLHLGDLHIGKTLGEFDLIVDQEYIFKQVLEAIELKKVDVVLIAGDVYDRAIPSEAAVNLFDRFLNGLAQRGVKTFIISGNHDSDDRLNFGSSLFETNGIYICGVYDGALYHRTITDEYGPVNVYMLPFVKASQVRHFFPKEKIDTYDDAVRVVIEHAGIDNTERNILVAHQFVTGDGKDPELSGSEGGSASNVGTIEKISYTCFEPFDYVALGHLHSAQQVGRESIRYSGSPLKYSLSEVNHTKSATAVTMGEKGALSMELMPLVPMRDLRHIKGTIEKLLSKEVLELPENREAANDFIYVTLTNEDVVDDAMGIFQQVYPNTVKIDYDNTHTRQLDEVEIELLPGQMTFGELIGEFYRQVYGVEISQEESEIMKEVAKEAGIQYETD